MSCRRHGRKPTIALWMLVAAADLAILTTAAGAVLTLALLATLVVFAGGVFAARMITQRAEVTTEAVVRRRA